MSHSWNSKTAIIMNNFNKMSRENIKRVLLDQVSILVSEDWF